MTAAPPSAADVLAELTAMLAGIVGAEARAVDTEERFPLLGLDSLLTVEFLAEVNARYGTRIAPGALYTYPTPKDLAVHLATQLGGPRPAPGPRDGAAVLRQLREQLAGILGCAPDDLDAGAAFAALGVDSLLAAQFMAAVNRTWELREGPDVLYRHPDLASLAAYIGARTGAAPDTAVPRTPEAPPAAADFDVAAVLDAVRDDLLTVDEAAALLGTRPA